LKRVCRGPLCSRSITQTPLSSTRRILQRGPALRLRHTAICTNRHGGGDNGRRMLSQESTTGVAELSRPSVARPGATGGMAETGFTISVKLRREEVRGWHHRQDAALFSLPQSCTVYYTTLRGFWSIGADAIRYYTVPSSRSCSNDKIPLYDWSYSEVSGRSSEVMRCHTARRSFLNRSSSSAW